MSGIHKIVHDFCDRIFQIDYDGIKQLCISHRINKYSRSAKHPDFLHHAFAECANTDNSVQLCHILHCIL